MSVPSPTDKDLEEVLRKLGISCDGTAISGEIEHRDALGMTTGTIVTGGNPPPPPPPPPPPWGPAVPILVVGVVTVVSGTGPNQR